MSTPPTIQQVIDMALAATPYDPALDTVDTVKTGDPHQPVTGIVTTFLASYEVLEQAIAKGANFIIVHEPTFYNHLDETAWLEHDPIYQSKRRLIDDHGLVIWRFHDYWHQHQPDGIMIGVLRALGWSSYADADSPYFCTLPPTTLEDLVAHLKSSLGISSVRLLGQPGMICQRVVLAVGAPGARMHIDALGRRDVDVAVCGEVNFAQLLHQRDEFGVDPLRFCVNICKGAQPMLLKHRRVELFFVCFACRYLPILQDSSHLPNEVLVPECPMRQVIFGRPAFPCPKRSALGLAEGQQAIWS